MSIHEMKCFRVNQIQRQVPAAQKDRHAPVQRNRASGQRGHHPGSCFGPLGSTLKDCRDDVPLDCGHRLVRRCWKVWGNPLCASSPRGASGHRWLVVRASRVQWPGTDSFPGEQVTSAVRQGNGEARIEDFGGESDGSLSRRSRPRTAADTCPTPPGQPSGS